MIFITLQSVKSCSLSPQSLASCVNYFWNCLLCFSKHTKGSVTSFSILFNFQGPVAPSASRLTAYLLYHRSDFCQALFLKFFVFPNLWVAIFSRLPPGILRPHIGSFVLLLSGVSEVILCRRAWCLSIIPHTPPFGNPFFHFFRLFFWALYTSASFL